MNAKRIIRTYTGLTVYPYKRKQCPYIEVCTSAPRYPHKGRIPFNGFYVKQKTFACRLFNNELLEQCFPDYDILPAVRYTEDVIYPYEFNQNIEFTDIQKSFIQQMVALTNNRMFLNLQTGFGKTFIMLEMISRIRKRAIIICYSTKVLKQWISSLQFNTSFKLDRLMLISDSSKLANIESGKTDISNIDIFLCTPTLIGSYAEKYGWTSVASVFEKMHLGVKVYDEAHRNIKMLTLIDAFTNVKRNFYLSADYSQADSQKRKLFYDTFYDAAIITLDKNIEKEMRYITGIVINYNTKPNELEQLQANRPNYGFSNFEYMKYQFNKKDIFMILDEVLNIIINQNITGSKILIATSMIEHVDLIYEHIKDKYISYHPARLYSTLTDDEKFKALSQSDMIISTVSSFGPGIDVKGIKYVIALDQFDTITDNQLSGRARPNGDEDAFYFMFNDIGFSYCVSKINKRLSYLSERKLKKINKLTI